MKSHIKKAVQSELSSLKKIVSPVNNNNQAPDGTYNTFIQKTSQLIDYMVDSPESPAIDISKKFNMLKDEVKLAYKIIQRSPVIGEYFQSSYNADYLNIVHHYFKQSMFIIVFFVGQACPARCIFCPNVSENPDGSRKLLKFIGNKEHLLNTEIIKQVFEDIRTMKEQGKKILVKISGGLEPLTDIQTMSDIIENAEKINVPVKLFTNGILLDTKERSDLALRTGDIRISLSTLNEQQYMDILFGRRTPKNHIFSFKYLLNNIRSLVSERDQRDLKARIGLNTVVLEENHMDMADFITLAENLNLDYIDFKPNYFNPYTKETEGNIEKNVNTIKKNNTGKHKSPVQLYFANSLFGKNMFWKYKTGYCKPHKQGRFKLFITPYGVCTPIHHMAFPYIEKEKYKMARQFQCGSLSTGRSLLDIIEHIPEMPELEYNKLNPFECMLSLEIEREEKNNAWGLPEEYNPYDFSMGRVLPGDIIENRLLKII